MPPRIVTADEAGIAAASARLASGELVVMPTETVYGLAGATHDPEALEKIYTLKGRPTHNPLIAHVPGADEARCLVRNWDERCDALADQFWPGPLTLILQRDDSVPPLASGGLETLAVRSPSHPVARSLMKAFGHPVSAPSANRSGRVSPTRPEHVVADYSDMEEASGLLVLDGGPCHLGIESTVLDLSGVEPRILRPGSLSRAELVQVIGEVSCTMTMEQDVSPGTGKGHYSPRTPMELLDRASIEKRMAEDTDPPAVLLLGGSTTAGNAIILERDPMVCAKGLYSALRELDATASSRLLVEKPPAGAGWDAIRDRLQRASTEVSTTRSAGGGSSGGSS